MSHQIDPVILQKLQAFSHRRRNLIITRGICAGVAMLLATMMVVALVDWLFVLPDWLRWTLSSVAYLAVIVVEWRSCLRMLVHAPGPRRLARLIEHAEPKLREDLISAVELGDPKSDAAFDSEQFRSLVQSDVAHRMEGMEVERLLPVNLVRRYLAIAAVIVVALVAGFAVTGMQFGTLLARALFPGANLARVSQFQISIVSPDPAEKIVPHGETVPLVASVSGGRVSKAVLEVFSETGGREVVQMTPLAGDQFSATVQVGRENVRYRVRAGDAITRKYEIGAVARPHVVAFAKTYQFPKYARMPDKSVSEENGDLIALEGSQVELRLKTNQAIRSGELRLDQGKQQVTIPLTAEADGQLVGKVPVSASGTYRVFLVGAQTGFENKFSPEYEIRAEPDLVPQVELELPKQDIIIPANEIVDIRGTASDDLPLAKVAQMTRVNEGPWKEFILAKDADLKAVVERRWDLFEQGAKVNDLLTIKLMVEDLKGHRVESRPIQITIAASGFESRRLTSLDAQRALFDSIRELRAAAEAFEKRANEARETFEKLPDGDAQRKQACISGAGAAEEFERKVTDVSTQLNAVLHTSGAGHESHDLVLLGRMLAKVNTGALQFSRDALEIAAANTATPGARDFMREFGEAAARTTQRARVLEDAYRIFLNSEEIDVLAENMYVVAQQQGRLAELARGSGADGKKWTQIADRMRVVTSETRALEAQMTASAPHDQNGERFKQMQKEIEKYRVAVDAAIAPGAQVDRMLDPTLKLAKATADASKRLLQFKRDVNHRPVEMARNVTNEVGPTWDNFDKLRQDVKAAAANDKAAPELRQMLVDRRWQRRGEFLKSHGDLEELRTNPDSFFVSDVRAATLALQGLKLVSGSDDWEKKLADTDVRFRLLESGHNLSEMLDGFNHLAVNERWDIYTPRSQTSNPRDWYWLEARMRMIPDELGKTQQPEQTRKIVEEARQILWKAQQQPAWKNVTEEMKDRFKVERTPMGLPQDVAKIAVEVKAALDLLRKPMEEARQSLEEMIPKISDVAEQLAKETADLKKETQQQAEKAADQKPEEAIAETQGKIAQQQKLNEKVEALKDLIRAEANKQNVMEKEGRENARDADDALAMLKEPPPKAEKALQDAVKAEQPELKEQAMHEATVQQQKLEDSLNQIAQHFENVEQGKAEETRTALRATEQENGVKEQLDAQFAKAEQLAEMAQKSPQDLLKELEQALPQNPEMRKALSQIAQDTLTGAEQKLAKASQTEEQVAKNLEQLAAHPEMANASNLQQAAKNAQEAAKRAVAAAENARQQADEAVQQAKKAGNQAAADQARTARAEATQAKENAQQAANAAEQAAQQSQNPQASQQTVQTAQQAAQKAADAAKNAEAAAPAAQQAKETAQQTSTQQTGEQQANNQQTSKEAGEAVKAAQDATQSAKAAEAAAQQLAAMAQAQAQSAKSLAENLQKATENAREAVKKAVTTSENARQQAEKAVQSAKTANNPTAANQSQTAQAEAAKAAQNAQQAAQGLEQMAQQSQNPQAAQQTAQSAQQAAQKAGESSQNAQAAAPAAKQAQETAQQSAAQQSGQEQANSQQAAKDAAATAQAAQQAADAAKAAQAALQQVAAIANPQSQPAPTGQQAPSPQLAQAAKQQQPIAQNAAQAGEEVSRAGRHEERLQNTMTGEQLQKLGEQIQQTAAEQVPAAQQALAQAQQAKQAQAPVNAANQELAKNLSQLQAATAPQTSPAGEPGQPQPGQPTPGQQPPGGQQPAAPTQLPAALQAGAPPSPGNQPGQMPNAQPAGQTPPPPGTLGALPASPQEQVWMARALDMLDAALNSQTPSAEGNENGQQQAAQNGQPQGQPGQQSQPGQPGQPGQQAKAGQPGQPGQKGQPTDAASKAMAQAQAAMAAAAQAAANAMKSARSEMPSQQPGQETKSELLDRSEGGTIAQGGKPYQTPGEAKNGKAGDWGKLPKQVAEELTQGQREAVAGEYRSQIETYYRVIAERAKKP